VSRCRRIAAVLAALFVGASATGIPSLIGQASAPTGTASPEAPTVYLITFGPGRLVWERFGHNALWIHDPVHGTDSTYDYGRFSFQQQNFILRFIQGRMWYSMGGATIDQYLAHYRQDNRSIWLQELDLPPEARLELQAFLQWNNRPEHREYHYDYYRDNCSTRVRDALDRVLQGQLQAQTKSIPVAATYRFHAQRLTTNDIPIYTGLYAALGPAVDRPLSEWEEMFLPLAMREHVRHVTVRAGAGREMPLVKTERTLYESTDPLPPAVPPSWTRWYLLVGLVTGAGVAFVGMRAASSRGAARMFAAWCVAWGGVAGIAGVILASLWLATDHVMAYHNLNLFYLNPVALPLALVVPLAVRGTARARKAAWVIAATVLGIAVLGVLLQLLPGVDQVNGSIIALTLPIHAGVAFAARAVAQGGARAAQNESRIPSIAASTTSRGDVRQA